MKLQWTRKKALGCNQPNITGLCHIIFIQICLYPVSDSVFCLILSPDRREALLLPSLQQGFCRQIQSQGSPTDPFGCEKIPMQELLQNLLQDVSSAQAWGIWLLCSTLNWDTFPPPEMKKSLSCFFIYFTPPNPGELSGNHIRGFVPKTFLFFNHIYKRSITFQRLLASSVSVIAISFLAFSHHVFTYLCYSCTFLHV